MNRSRRNWTLLLALWAAVTLVGEVLLFAFDWHPRQWAEEAEVVDEAFRLLTFLAVPVFALVVAALITFLVAFRVPASSPVPDEDGPPVRTHQGLVRGWVGVTGALAVLIAINPGLVGLADLRGSDESDLVVTMTAQRWAWRVTYENKGTTFEELVLPVDKRVRVDVQSLDIVHSFWIPAFRAKVDAVPGRTTVVRVTPTREGSQDDDVNLRVQCAELCGLGHAAMAIPVRIVPEAEFEKYVNGLEKE